MLASTLTTITALSFLLPAYASPHPTSYLSPQPTASSSTNSIPLHYQHSRQHSPDLAVRQSWLADQAAGLRSKYASQLSERDAELHARHLAKRAVANVSLVDIGVDASYAAQITIGSPAQQFLVIMDTGSADLWVAGQSCDSSTCLSTTRFDPADSRTYQSSGQAFAITYGSGQAKGVIAYDTVQLGGFTVNSQGLGECTRFRL